MNRVLTAIESGRCVLGVSQSLLRDAEVMLELRQRSALPAMALSGPATAPAQPVNEAALARAVAQPGGVVVLVEPEMVDNPGIEQLGRIVSKGPHTPTVLVVARAFNPLLFGSILRGVAVAHIKDRGKSFLKALPIPQQVEPPPQVAAAREAAASGPEAPAFAFVGREEEMGKLGEMLGQGGPIVISGPQGVGRTWLAEHAIAASGLKRLPDFTIAWGSGADALFARLAEICLQGGSDTLATTLRGPHTPAQAVAAALASLGAASLDDRVMVVHGVHHALGREGDFFRKGRLEMLLEALLTNACGLRIVFLSERQPVFYREGAASALRRLPIVGVKGRFLHEIFAAYKAPEFPRDKFGPINEKIHGHPMAARAYAIAVRAKGLELVDDPKFLKMESVEDVDALEKHLHKRIDKIQGPERDVLARLAHLRMTISGAMFSELGIGRKGRIELLAKGLLDMVGTNEDRRYQVHPLIKQTLSLREISDFDVLARLAEIYHRQARDASDPVEKLALAQEGNRCALTGRAFKSYVDLGYPDADAAVESVHGLIRGQKPHFPLALQRLSEVTRRDAANADAWLLRAETLERSEAKPDQVADAYDEGLAAAPVPELYHAAVNFFLGRRARAKAIAILEKGVEALPTESRLRTRLAVLLLREGRRNEAIDHLKQAMELDPMLPDAYGIMGMAKRDEGREALDDAETLLREAVRLGPDDPVQASRLADLLLLRAKADPDRRKAFLEEANTLLDSVVKGDRKSPEAHLLYAQLIRESGGDIDRATWLVKQVKKSTDRGSERNARVALEFALLDLARNDLDKAETTIRGLMGKDPSNDRLFAALAQVLEARQQYIPAHAEYQRARDRVSPISVERMLYDRELERLQALIEAQAAGLFDEPSEAPAPTSLVTGSTAARTIRRPKAQGEPAPGEAPSAEPDATADVGDDPTDEVPLAEAQAPEAVETTEETPEDEGEATEPSPAEEGEPSA